MAGKRKSAGIFSALTVGEADVLKSVLVSGAQVAVHVDKNNHDMFMETYGVVDDVREARRQRWNAENPGHQIGA